MSEINNKKLEQIWDEFVNNLNDEGFDGDLREYLNAIKFISAIDILQIDESEYRNDIEKKISKIVQFIDNYKKEYYEISCIKGFKCMGNINGRDYYYYIADQQVKASVYYVRYLNFLYKSHLDQITIKDIYIKICEFKEKAYENCEITVAQIKKECEEIINEINNGICKLEQEDNENSVLNKEDIKHQCIKYLNEIELSENIEYKKYLMFNNMMREIRFFGAAYQYLWHWKKEKKTLYRCGDLAGQSIEELPKSKQEYIKKMFNNSINHMNSPSNIRHSFSENLLLDIYKYLILPKQESNQLIYTDVFDQDGIEIKSYLLENNKTVEFNIIKEADINSIYMNKEVKSFHEFIIGETPSSYDLPFTVEMYPQSLEGERNDKETTKGMRDTLLPIYFHTWGIDCSLSKTKVADDKEVITYGRCYKNIEDIDNVKSLENYEQYDSGTLFTMAFDKEDIMYLLLKINERKNKMIEDIVKIIIEKMSLLKVEGSFDQLYSASIQFCKHKLVFDVNKENKFEMEVTTGSNHFQNGYIDEKNEKLSMDTAKKVFVKKVKENTKNYLINRYSNINKNKSLKGDFVLSTMKNDNYNFLLVKQYTEYMVNMEDAEIAMLKHLIFKE